MKDKILKVIKSRKSIQTLSTALALVLALNGCTFGDKNKDNKDVPVEPTIGIEQTIGDDHNHDHTPNYDYTFEDEHEHDHVHEHEEEHNHTEDNQEDENNINNDNTEDKSFEDETKPIILDENGIPETPVKFDTQNIKMDENGHYVINGMIVPDLSKSSYKGVSIVDALYKEGYRFDREYLRSLATLFGIENYRGTAEQNTYLLNQLRTWAIGLELDNTNPEETPEQEENQEQEDQTHTHSWTEWKMVAPTCTEMGMMTRTCAECGEVEENAYVPALGHAYGEMVVKQEATCTEDGYSEATCSRCGETKTFTINKTGHTLAETVISEPTCTEDGEKLIMCINGDYTQTVVIPALGHNYGAVSGWTVSDDGTKDIKTQTCSNCGDVKIVDSRTHKGPEDETPEIPTVTEHWGEWVITTQPTCEDEGIETRLCLKHNGQHQQTRTIAALGHDKVWQVTTAATCTEDGEETLTCTRCNQIYDTRVINKLGHSYSEWTEWSEWSTPDINNIQTSTRTRTCNTCGFVDTDTKTQTYTPPTHEHSWSGWTVVTPATCTENGQEKRTCSCGDEETRTINALGHNLVENITKVATCTEDGEKTITCSRGDYSQTISIPATGHNFGEWVVTTPATADNDGVETRECSTCHTKETKTIPALGHHMSDWVVTTEATCTEDGIKTKTCTDPGCDKVITETIPALGHSMGEWTITKNPTCTEDGKEEVICTRCNSVISTTIIPATGHQHTETINAKAATCEEQGYTGDTYCKACGTKIASGTIINATGHNFGEWVTTKEPTCGEKGLEERECSTCHQKETNELATTEHSYGTATITTEATCSTEGSKTSTCTECGKVLVENIPTTAHTMITITTEATCTSDGKVFDKCSVCGHEEVISTTPALGHDYSINNGTVQGTATITSEGLVRVDTTTYECSRCSSTYKVYEKVVLSAVPTLANSTNKTNLEETTTEEIQTQEVEETTQQPAPEETIVDEISIEDKPPQEEIVDQTIPEETIEDSPEYTDEIADLESAYNEYVDLITSTTTTNDVPEQEVGESKTLTYPQE